MELQPPPGVIAMCFISNDFYRVFLQGPSLGGEILLSTFAASARCGADKATGEHAAKHEHVIAQKGAGYS